MINDTLSLSNLVNDSTLTETGGGYVVDLKRSLFNVDINDLLTIPDTTISANYTISFAFINVPPNYDFVNQSEEYALDLEGVELREVVLKNGYIDVKVSNPAGTKAFFNVKLPGASLAGTSLDETIIAPAGSNTDPGVVTSSFDLKGYKLDLTGIAGSVRNSLRTDVKVTSDPDGPTVQMTNGDITKVDVTLRDVEVEYAKGYFGDRVFSDTTSLPLDVFNMIESGTVDLPQSTVKFEIENGVKVGASGLLTKVNNTNNAGSTVDLTHPQIGNTFFVDPALGSWDNLAPSSKIIEFNAGNSNIESYLENLGNTHEVGYKIQLNPWGNVSGGTDEIFLQSRLKVNLLANMPLAIGMDNLSVIDTFAFSLDQDPNKTHVTKGELLLKTSNAFPFSAGIELILLDEQMNPLHTVAGTSPINSAQFGALNPSLNLMVADSDLKFVLSEAVLEDISKVAHIMVRAVFNTTNATTGLSEQMSIPAGAFLAVKLRTRFTTENRF